MSWGIILVGSLAACAPGTIGTGSPTPGTAGSQDGSGTPASASTSPLQVVYAETHRGISAIWDDGTNRLELRAQVDEEGLVQSTISDHGRVVTRMTVPLANAADLGAQIGPAALAASKDHTLIAVDQAAHDRLRQLLPVYATALTALYRATDGLGASSLRMALPWHEEVLGRLVVGDLPSDAEFACPEAGRPLHTALMHMPELTSLMQSTHNGGAGNVAAPMCNLGCSWYDVCCQHDQACVYCNHWWCGWSCVPGCFGGNCGGGQ